MFASNARWPRTRFRRVDYRIGVAIALLTTCSIAARAQATPEWVPKVRAWVSANQHEILRDLTELLAIPNVAADRSNVRRNAEHLRRSFAARGFNAELLETSGNPLVYAEL